MLPGLPRPHRLVLAGVIFLVAAIAAGNIRLATAQVLVDTEQTRRFPRPPHWPVPLPTPRPAPPPSRYRIKELTIDANVKDSVAHVQMGQTFVNTGSSTMQVQFVFPLPYDGAVSQMTFMVDGKEYEGKLMDAKKAREIYELYVRKLQDPALMEWVGWGMFQTSVFPIPAGASRTVTLKYTQVCRQQNGVAEFLFPLATAKYTAEAIDAVSVRVQLQSDRAIGNIYSPTSEIQIERPSEKRATIKYDLAKSVPQHDFRLFWDEGADGMQAKVLSYRPKKDDDGYFLLLLQPETAGDRSSAESKTVMFVVDRSGSMNGKKMEQAKSALQFVLNNLNEGDLFNIIAYDSTVEQFRPELQRYDSSIKDAAAGFVEGLHAGGSTNIDAALGAAMGQIQTDEDPAFVIFLTDGIPTVGEQNEAKIVHNTGAQNKHHARVFSFGVGFDVNSRLLDKLSRDNHGQTEYVRPDEDLEAIVSSFYDRIGLPVLTEVSLEFQEIGDANRSTTNRVYPGEVRDLFSGEQVVVTGRYSASGSGKLVVRGKTREGEVMRDFDVQLAEPSSDPSLAFVARLWATRRIGAIIDEIDLEGRNQELIDELVRLSEEYGILTPYTSFLADDQPTQLAGQPAVTEFRNRASDHLLDLEKSSGADGFNQRAFKAELQRSRTAMSAPALPAGVASAAASGRASDADRPQSRIAQIQGKTFYHRQDRWVEAGISADEERQAETIERFSDTYFGLLDQHGTDVAKYLGLDGPITLRLGTHIYRVGE